MKDNFSTRSDLYARFRPSYPPEFYTYLMGLLPNKKHAWDCGTGNGQVAAELSAHFRQVFATDISQEQIKHAHKAKNIHYSVQPAEKTGFSESQFDLITVAQAIHWFNFDEFYREVRRTSVPGGILAVMGYSRIQIPKEIDEIITDFYENTIGEYWDSERHYIDEGYRRIPFPFDEIQSPGFESTYQWDLDHLTGYLNTWSAVKHYISANQVNPVDELKEKLKAQWEDKRTVTFPMLLRIGKIDTT